MRLAEEGLDHTKELEFGVNWVGSQTERRSYRICNKIRLRFPSTPLFLTYLSILLPSIIQEKIARWQIIMTLLSSLYLNLLRVQYQLSPHLPSLRYNSFAPSPQKIPPTIFNNAFYKQHQLSYSKPLLSMVWMVWMFWMVWMVSIVWMVSMVFTKPTK